MLAIPVDGFNDWRQQARALLENRVSPEHIEWLDPQQGGLFVHQKMTLEHARSARAKIDKLAKPPVASKQFVSMAKQAACFEDRDNITRKWSVMYSLLWRMNFGQRNVLALNSDPDVQHLQRMVKSVSRDMHKMKAFVRFQSNQCSAEVFARSSTADEGYYTAWFEPEHAIIEEIAPFFVKRFTGMTWSILTPRGCAHWNQQELKLSPGTSKPAIAADEFETFWKAYYSSIFNPARLKEKAMMAEMPKKYWQYLPEASCIRDLCRESASTTVKMLNSELTSAERVRQKSPAVNHFQNALRQINRD